MTRYAHIWKNSKSVEDVPFNSRLELWVYNKWTKRHWGTKRIATIDGLSRGTVYSVLRRFNIDANRPRYV